MLKRFSLRTASLLLAALFIASGVFLRPAAAQSKAPASKAAAAAPSPADQQLLSRVESYLRDLFGWGPDYKMHLGPATPSRVPGLLKVPVAVTFKTTHQTGTVWVTKDAHFMIRGEIRDMHNYPWAKNLSKITTNNSPSIGPADAKVTVVEFSDFECPHCQEMFSVLQQVIPEFPQVRFVFKNFPLTQIHPWAMTAALAGRCVFEKSSSAAFEKFQAADFTNQASITPDTAWDQLTQYATAAAGITADALHACMTDPATKAAVNADIAEGKALQVDSTPTFFIDGRPTFPSSRADFEEDIRFELSRVSSR